MGFVDDDAVEGARRRTLGRVRLVEDAGDQRLDGRDLYLIFVFWNLLFQPCDLVDLGEVEHAFDLGRFQRVVRLFAKGFAVDEEEDASEPLMLQQPVHQCDTGTRLARAGRHGDEDLALTCDDRILDRSDRLFLIGAHLAFAEAFLGQALGGGVEIGLQNVEQIFWREPNRERPRMICITAQGAEPNAGLGLPLADERAAIGGEDEGHAERIRQPMLPRSIRMAMLRWEFDSPGITFRLVQC